MVLKSTRAVHSNGPGETPVVRPRTCKSACRSHQAGTGTWNRTCMRARKHRKPHRCWW